MRFSFNSDRVTICGMNELPLEGWERIYRRFFFGLLIVVGVVVGWGVASLVVDDIRTRNWRLVLELGALVAWVLIFRVAMRIPRLQKAIVRLATGSFASVLLLNLTVMGLPAAIVFYLAPRSPHWGSVISLAVTIAIVSVFQWRSAESSTLKRN